MLLTLKNKFFRKKVLRISCLWVVSLTMDVLSLGSCPSISQEDSHFLESLKGRQERMLSKAFSRDDPLKREEASFLIFVSFSLPASTLQSLYKDAKKVGGKLVLRGLYQNSFQKTVLKLIEMKIEVTIDPLLFRKYSVTVVPTFLLVEGERALDLLKERKEIKLSGHVSSQYALQQMMGRGSLKAAELLSQLEERR